MNSKEYMNKYISEAIRKGRVDGIAEQEIYNNLASEGYDREYIIKRMTYTVHPEDAKRAKWYNRILISMMIFGILIQFINGGAYSIVTIILYILFIYFFAKNNLSAYYWYLFFAILGSISTLPALLETHSIIALGIGGSILLVPILICYKVINILLPHKEGKNIGMTSNGVHVFLK